MRAAKPHYKEKERESSEVIAGHFPKRDAAQYIYSGAHHVHSCSQGATDPFVVATQKALMNGDVPTYSWELPGAMELEVATSAERFDRIKEVTNNPLIKKYRDLREKVEGILEELLTNAIYHSYFNIRGERKYKRRDSVKLDAQETVKIRFIPAPDGIFLEVSDGGGAIRFDHVRNCFHRCYGSEQPQIEAKESGAGLGLYMIFESATHLKIVCDPYKRTTISCWIADKGNFDPDTFSFNYFERRKP